MEILNICISVLVICGCAIISSEADENTTLYNCQATVFSTKLNSTIKCVDSSSFNGDYDPKYMQYSNNQSLRIYWTHNGFPTEISAHKLTCTSSTPLSNEIYFEDGKPNIEVNVHHERVKSQFGSSTQKYIMTFLLPTYVDNWESFAVKFKIFNKEDLESAVYVLFTFKAEVQSPCFPYSLSENSDILIDREIITIPCLSFDTTAVLLYRKNATGDREEEELKVDNHSLSFDPMEGFKLNTTLLTNSEGKYTCHCNDEGRDKTRDLLFSVGKYKPNVPQNQTIYVYHPDHNFYIITGSSKTSFDLECGNPLRNVTIEREHTSTLYRNGSTYSDSKSTQISEFPLNITIKHYKDGISSPYLASAEVPYLNTSERTALKIVDKNANYEYAVHRASLRCTDSNSTLHNWNIEWVGGYIGKTEDYIGPLRYENQRFWCDFEDYDVELRRIECETPTECRSLLKCLETEEVAGKRENKVNCDQAIITTKGNSVVSQQIFIANDDCSSATRRLKCGIVQCLSSRFNVLQPYFQGFDNKLYFTTEPPLQAIMKLRILSAESDLYTNGRQTLLCEAHQFFYEHGIQWDFKNLKGTSISPDFLHHVTENNSDFLYPKSTIEVSFAEVTEVEIVCLAPQLYKREWQNTTTVLKLKKSLPPEFYSKDTDVYFDENKKDQSIPCEANGLPQPQVRWIRNNEVIDDDSRIVDSVFKKVLLFPTYNESLSGEYICEASNSVGNKSLRFQVFTASASGLSSLLIILITSGFCLVILILSVFFVIYLRMEKVKKYREMKQLIATLNGNAESTDNPIEFPFDTKLELEKHSFHLDKGMLLGKGEFGEVYKGRIAGVDGFIAFKTLSRNCSISHTKALVAEIKMLMYVGEHPNLVELIGVYRKEIKQGILYMALEFCDLGSLESYLRSYKHLFIKCPIINSYINIDSDSVQRAGKEVAELNSIHSMKTLIKWCYQIAYAMEYLGTKNVVHSDLATRNVLLTIEANAKVTDFGLSRRTYNYTEYIKKAKDALPWRWLALESLLTNTFSSKSDVWAFGITLWEIFSLGEMPYPGMNPTLEFVEELKNGLRNFKPNYASQELYQVMCECWHPQANQRPSFSALRIIFQSAFSRNEANIHSKISQDSNLEQIAKELSAAVYCDLDEL